MKIPINKEGAMRLAIHEAGHAVASHHFGNRLERIIIERHMTGNSDTLGSMKHGKMKHGKWKDVSGSLKEKIWPTLERIAVISLAGATAEHIYDDYPEKINIIGASGDLEIIRRVFLDGFKLQLTSQEVVDAFFLNTLEILENKWPAVLALATALVKEGSLSGERAEQVIEENL